MNDKFDEPREGSCLLAAWGLMGSLSRGELAKGPARSVARRQAFQRFGGARLQHGLKGLLTKDVSPAEPA